MRSPGAFVAAPEASIERTPLLGGPGSCLWRPQRAPGIRREKLEIERSRAAPSVRADNTLDKFGRPPRPPSKQEPGLAEERHQCVESLGPRRTPRAKAPCANASEVWLTPMGWPPSREVRVTDKSALRCGE